MRVLFVTEQFVIEPLGLGYLAATLKKSGHIVDQLRYTDKNFINQVRLFNPNIVAYSVTTGKEKKFLEINDMIKASFKVFSVFGGSHPTYYPEFQDEEGVDMIVRGEADRSFPRFVDNYEVANAQPKVLEFGVLEQNLDSIPFPDRDFMYKYEENMNNPIKNVMTSRGCPYACPYCFNSIYREFYKGQKFVRYRSVSNVIEECIELKENYPVEFIFFQDDDLVLNPNFKELMEEYGKKVGIPFHCQLRVDHLTEEKAFLLYQAGCTGITFAIECGNVKQRYDMLNRKISDDQILSGAKLCSKYGLKLRTENMVGLPGESLGMMLETVAINQRVKPMIGWASIFQPYPELPLGKYAIDNGYWDGKDAFSESFFETTVLKTKIKKEIVNLQRLFGVIVTFNLPRWLIKILIKIPNNRLYDKLYNVWKQRQYGSLFR